MTIQRVGFVLLAVPFLFLSCSRPSGLPQASGGTAALQRNPGSTLFWVDEIGGVKNPYNNKSVQVSGTEDFTARGWAVDKQSQAPAGGVDVVIDNVPYRATYGIDRPDVSEAAKVEAYRRSGWRFSMPAAQLKGTHTFAIRILTNDGKSYYEIPSLTVVIG